MRTIKMLGAMGVAVLEKIGTIKNPLTIIAMFAGIAELSGAVVLPFISEANQSTFMWFLMLFPLLLVSVFFLTLNFNHRVLYAPSDYQDEDNFIKSLEKASVAERAQKLQGEIETVEAAEADQSAVESPAENVGHSISYKELVKKSAQASYMLAEDLIFEKLSKEFQGEIQREVKLGSLGGRFIFDGLVEDKSGTTAIEVKFLRSGPIVHRLEDSLRRIAESAKLLPDKNRKNFKVLLAIATDHDDLNQDRVKKHIDVVRDKFEYPVEVRFYKLADLEREFAVDP